MHEKRPTNARKETLQCMFGVFLFVLVLIRECVAFSFFSECASVSLFLRIECVAFSINTCVLLFFHPA